MVNSNCKSRHGKTTCAQHIAKLADIPAGDRQQSVRGIWDSPTRKRGSRVRGRGQNTVGERPNAKTVLSD